MGAPEGSEGRKGTQGAATPVARRGRRCMEADPGATAGDLDASAQAAPLTSLHVQGTRLPEGPWRADTPLSGPAPPIAADRVAAVERVMLGSHQGQHQALLRLGGRLGGVELSLVWEGGAVRAAVLTAPVHSRQTLGVILGEVRRRLADKGIVLAAPRQGRR